MAFGLTPVDTGTPSTSTPPPAPSSPSGQTPSSVDPGLSYLNGVGTISNGSFTPFGGSAGPIPGPPNTGSPSVAGQQAANNANAYQNAAIYSPPGTTPAFTATSPQPPPQTIADLLDSFPGVQQAQALGMENLGFADAALKSARERAIINFGDPALSSMAGFGLDPQAGAFAQQNYLSGNATLARLDKAHQLAAQGIINGLAAHGILNSGDLGYREGQENQNYGNTVYDARQAVLDQLAELYNTYLGQRASFSDSVTNAINQALSAFMSNPDALAGLFGGGSTTTTNPGDNRVSPSGYSTYAPTPGRTTYGYAPAEATVRNKQTGAISYRPTRVPALTGPAIGAFK